MLKSVEEEKKAFLCKYQFLLNEENQLTHFIYVSTEMEQIYQKFHDVLIIDTTLKKTRFNLSLMNFVCIDNYGFSRIVAFGLLYNEKQITFEWILSRFCEIMNNIQPQIIFTDEDDQLSNGIILLNFVSLVKL